MQFDKTKPFTLSWPIGADSETTATNAYHIELGETSTGPWVGYILVPAPNSGSIRLGRPKQTTHFRVLRKNPVGVGAASAILSYVLPTTVPPAIGGAPTIAVDAGTSKIYDETDVRPPLNTAPVVSAGADQTVQLPNTVTLTATVTDDGSLMPPSFKWECILFPDSITLADILINSPTDRVTSVTFPVQGEYVFQFSANDGEFTTTDSVTVTVFPAAVANVAPTVASGNDQTITLPALATLVATVSDDGLPATPGVTTVQWSTVSAPATGVATFSAPTATTTTVDFNIPGTYTLRCSAFDGALTTTDDIVITVNAGNKPPVVSAGPDLTVILPATATLDGTITDDGLPNPPATVTPAWTKTSGPGTVTFGNSALVDTTATFSTNGTYVLRLTGNDSALSAFDETTVVVNPAPSATSVKFQPGHYGRIIHDPTRGLSGVTMANEWLGTTGFKTRMKGFQAFINWATLEPTQGNFVWTAIDDLLTICTTEDLYLIVHLMDKSFQNTSPTGVIPPDVPSFTTTTGGVCAKRWTSTWSTRIIQMYTQIGSRYSTNLRFIGVGTPETALNITWTTINPNIQTAKDIYRDSLITAFTGIAPVMGHNAFYIGVNHPDEETFLEPIFNFAATNHRCGIFWPDPHLKSPNLLWYQKVRQRAGVIGAYGGAQTHHITSTDTPAVIDFYVDNLKTHYIMHNHEYTGVANYKSRVVNAVNAANGKIVSTVPTNLSPVYTGG